MATTLPRLFHFLLLVLIQVFGICQSKDSHLLDPILMNDQFFHFSVTVKDNSIHLVSIPDYNNLFSSLTQSNLRYTCMIGIHKMFTNFCLIIYLFRGIELGPVEFVILDLQQNNPCLNKRRIIGTMSKIVLSMQW